ncbi:MAG: DUF4149 domain-containing protein [Caldimonas sp.]
MNAAALRRPAAWLAGAWAGIMIGLGFIAAPVLFSALERADAGRVAARLFTIDAYLGLAFGVTLLVIALQRARGAKEQGGTRFSADMLLALAALFCTLAGHFALQPMVEAARGGTGTASFAVLHGVASAFFALKFAVVAVLAWRLAAAPRCSSQTSSPKAAAPVS